MYYNPFILKRTNHFDKKLFQKMFGKIELDQYFAIQQHMDSLKLTVLADLNTQLTSENSQYILQLIRSTKGQKEQKLKNIMNKIINNDVSIALKTCIQFVELLKAMREEEERIFQEYDALLCGTRLAYIQLMQQSPDLAITLLQINPTIYHKLKSYIEKPISNHNKKERKLESTLYNYVTRLIWKTSPFSNLTSVARSETRGRQFERKVSLNFTLIYRITLHYLYKSDYFINNVKFSLPPLSFIIEEGQHYINFLVRLPDKESKRILYPLEGFRKIKVTAAVYHFLEKLDLYDYFDVQDFFVIFNQQLPSSNIIKLTKKYVEIGLFIPVIGFDESSSDHLINDILKQSENLLESEQFKQLGNILTYFVNATDRILHVVDFHEFKDILDDIDKFLTVFNTKLDMDYKSAEIFYIDSFYPDLDTQSSELANNIIEKTDLNNIEKFQIFNLIFDKGLRVKYELKQRIKEKYEKRCIDLDTDFFDLFFDFSKEILPLWSDAEYDNAIAFHSPEVNILNKLMREFLKELKLKMQEQEGDVLDITPLIDRYIKRIPFNIKKNEIGSTMFLQYGYGLTIINACYESNEKYFARFMNYFDEYLSENKAYQSFAKDHYVANNYYELSDSYGFNGNVKKNRLTKQCHTAGVGNARFLNNDIIEMKKIEDFQLLNDDSYNVLIDTKTDKVVNICLRGSLTPALMPGYVAVFLQLFSVGAMYYKIPEFLSEKIIPRFQIGSVVIGRRRIRLSQLPRDFSIKEKEDEKSYFVRINRIFMENNYSQEFFIVLDGHHDFKDKKTNFKPMYIYLASPMSCLMFSRLIKKFVQTGEEHFVFLEEVLSNEEAVAEEFQIEFYKGSE